MKLEIVGVRDKGIISKERLVLRASDAGDAGDFIILCTETHSDGLPLSGSPVASFWMPDLIVDKGDFIILYTKTGVQANKMGSTGKTMYFYYLNKTNTIWNSTLCAVVCNVSGHDFERIS
jgi:hypothetical protein